MRAWALTFCVIGFWNPAQLRAEEPLPLQAEQALHRAVAFYHSQVASHGGYVYRYGADLQKREGEGKTGLDTVWVQPPGTPSVGLAYVEAYRRYPTDALLAAARDAGQCLIQGQLRSGGWTNSIEFGESRSKFAYRVEPERKKQFNVSTFDDNKTQSAIRFLVQLDEALGFADPAVHESAMFALQSVLSAQFPNGGWPQGYTQPAPDGRYLAQPARFPATWSRTAVGSDYWHYCTLNDNNIRDIIDTLLLAYHVYQTKAYQEAALRAGDFLIAAQMPEPQPAWAQQYDFDMQPTWARKFEPPAVTGGESQGAIEILQRLYIETGDRKFLQPIPRALDYLRRSRLPDGRLARFYELQTNRPLYFNRAYELTYDPSDMPTHYGFIVDSKVESLTAKYHDLLSFDAKKLERLRVRRTEKRELSSSLEKAARAAIAALDDRGAWVEDGRLSYHGKSDDTRRIIESSTFIKNLNTLSMYLAAAKAAQ